MSWALFARAFLAWSLAELGRFDEAGAVGEESLRMAQAIDEPYTLMHGYFGAGIPYLARGDVARAIPPLERGLALCQATENHLWLGEIAADLGLAYALAGRIDDALPVLEFALKEAATTGPRQTYARQHAQVGEGYLLAGQRDEAARLVAIALEAARAQKQRGQEAAALKRAGGGQARLAKPAPQMGGARSPGARVCVHPGAHRPWGRPPPPYLGCVHSIASAAL